MRNQKKSDSAGTVSKDGNVTLVLKRDRGFIIGGWGVGNFFNILAKDFFFFKSMAEPTWG